MSILKKIIKTIFHNKVVNNIEKSNTEDNEVCNEMYNEKVREFIDGKRNHLSATDVFPDLKVFQPVKTSKSPSAEEIEIRLKSAEDFIPLPAGYKDACICMRMIIRKKIKEKKDFIEDLNKLYKIACEYNFFESHPYLEELKEPSLNLSEGLKKAELAALDMPYMNIGYQHISVLNKTDIKWLTSSFGEPNNHVTVSEYHNDAFNRALSLLEAKRKKKKLRVLENG